MCGESLIRRVAGKRGPSCWSKPWQPVSAVTQPILGRKGHVSRPQVWYAERRSSPLRSASS